MRAARVAAAGAGLDACIAENVLVNVEASGVLATSNSRRRNSYSSGRGTYCFPLNQSVTSFTASSIARLPESTVSLARSAVRGVVGA